MNVLAIIAARGGSKRIPRKNIRDFLGKPIIAYSIEAALHSGIFSEVMVSTEDVEIAEIAKKYGAVVPFMRSTENADDAAGADDVWREVLLKYREQGREFEYFCGIYPTAPFISPERLMTGWNLLMTSDGDLACSVVAYSFPIQRALRIVKNRLFMIQLQYQESNSQNLETTYHDAGQFYWYRTLYFLSHPKCGFENAVPVLLPESEVQDIDNEEDWKVAEMKYRLFHKQYKGRRLHVSRQ